MGRETKLGLVFVGILLTVFCALLIKRLTRPTNLPAASLAGSASVKTGESSPVARLPQPMPPKMVTPASENSRPPEDPSGQENMWSARNSAAYGGESQTPRGGASLQTSATPPTATPIADLASQAGSNPATANDTWQSRAAGSPSAAESSTSTSLAVPYQSSYGSAGEYSTLAPGGNSTNSNLNRSSEPPARLEAYDAQSVDTGSTQSRSNSLPSRSPDATATAATSGIATNWPNQSAAGSYLGDDPQAAANSKRATAQAPANQTIGIQTSNASAPGNPMPMSQSAASSISTTQYSSSQLHGASTSTIAAVAPPPVAIARNGEQYTVQPNDSYWTISEKVYGTGGYFKALYEYNRKRSKFADELKLGQVLLVPEESVLRRAYPDLCPKPRRPAASGQQRLASAVGRTRGAGKVYVVTEGDTLFEIARHELGKPSRWAEIYQLNHDVLGDDTDYLLPGTELILPVANESPRNNTAIRQPEPLSR